MRVVLILAAMLAIVAPVRAQELVLGVGHSAYLSPGAQDSTVLSLDLRSRPLGTLGSADVSAQLVADAHTRGDRFVGIGLAARWPLNGGWFIDAALAPGWYKEATPANALGSGLEFRTQLGLGQTLGHGRAWSVAFVHKSNAGTGRFNPGMHGLLLRWHQAF